MPFPNSNKVSSLPFQGAIKSPRKRFRPGESGQSEKRARQSDKARDTDRRNQRQDQRDGGFDDIYRPGMDVNPARLQPVGNFLGGTILMSPDEAVHPMDCELWPDSPFCGGDLINLGDFTGIEIEVQTNGYETVMLIKPTLAWLSLPPMIFGYRSGGPPPKKVNPPIEEGSEIVKIHPINYGKSGCLYLVQAQCEIGDSRPFTHYKDPSTNAYIVPRGDKGIYSIVFGPVESMVEINGQMRHDSENRPTYYSSGVEIIAHGDTHWPGGPPSWKGPYFNTYRSGGCSGANEIANLQLHRITLIKMDLILGIPNGAAEAFALSQQITYNNINCTELDSPLAPPPPSLPPEDPPMCDCKKIEADLKAIKKFLGVKKEPWNIPADLGKKSGGQTTIPDIAEMMIYFMKQMSGMLGATGEMKIKVKDANITQEGNQEVELEFPNLAEAITNLAGLALTNQSISVATLQASMRGIIQSGQAFTSAAVAAEQTEVIMEWLGFKTQKESFEVPLVYTPGETSPDKFLRESTAKVSYWDVDDKTGLQTYLNAFVEAANLIKASLFQGVVGGTDLSYRIKTAAKDLKVTSQDLDSFIESVEQGFPDLPGSDVANPYGRPYDERPKIRKLGGNQDESEP